jgi:hypothetical protein
MSNAVRLALGLTLLTAPAFAQSPPASEKLVEMPFNPADFGSPVTTGTSP